MFGHTPSNTPLSEVDKNSQELKTLLEAKYLNVKVRSVSASNSEIKVTLLNGRHGVNEGIDGENERPIAYLQSFDANVSKEKAEYHYWSLSVITIQQFRLKEIIDGLKAMPIPTPKDNIGKVMAKC